MFCGCVSSQHPDFVREPPQDGRIEVFVDGNVSAHGSLWLPEGANLTTLEDLLGVHSEWESRKIRIHRKEAGGWKTVQIRIEKMSRAEKEKISLHHGDFVFFVYDRCWG